MSATDGSTGGAGSGPGGGSGSGSGSGNTGGGSGTSPKLMTGPVPPTAPSPRPNGPSRMADAPFPPGSAIPPADPNRPGPGSPHPKPPNPPFPAPVPGKTAVIVERGDYALTLCAETGRYIAEAQQYYGDDGEPSCWRISHLAGNKIDGYRLHEQWWPTRDDARAVIDVAAGGGLTRRRPGWPKDAATRRADRAGAR